MVSLASDTQEDRDSSKYWSIAGYLALGMLLCVTCLGWCCQRYLRNVLRRALKSLDNRSYKEDRLILEERVPPSDKPADAPDGSRSSGITLEINQVENINNGQENAVAEHV